MSRHIAPHLWAEAERGNLSARKTAAMANHALTCERCDAIRARVLGAPETFAALRREPAPELPWETLRANIHWETSSSTRMPAMPLDVLQDDARRRQEAKRDRSRRRGITGWPGFALAATGAAAAVVVWQYPSAHVTQSHPTVATAPSKAIDASASPAVGLVGVVTLAQGDVAVVDGKGSSAAVTGSSFGQVIGAGSTIRTNSDDGQVAIQFGQDSAFSIGAHAAVKLAQFDRHNVELDLVGDGRLDVVVSSRAPGQRFWVRTGDRVVEVRGTQFRVERHAQHVAVACEHGVVAVSGVTGASFDPRVRDEALAGHLGVSPEVVVRGAQAVAVDDDQVLTTSSEKDGVRSLSVDERAALVAATPYQLAVWPDVGAAADPSAAVQAAVSKLSAPLTVQAAAGQAVRVDGLTVGRGDVAVRVVSGRHAVETEQADGKWRGSGWIDVGTQAAAVDARVVVPVSVNASAPVATEVAGAESATSVHAVSVRRRRADMSALDARLHACVRSLEKMGITGSNAELQITVDRDGAVEAVNLLSTDLPPTMADCVRSTVASSTFPPGPALTWRQRVTP